MDLTSVCQIKDNKRPRLSFYDTTGLRGVAEGRITVGKASVSKRPCVLFGELYPMWLTVVEQMGFNPVLVVLLSDRFVPVVQTLVPPDCRIMAVRDWASLGEQPPTHFDAKGVVAFVDGRLTPTTLHLCEAMRIPVAMGRGSVRNPTPGWASCFGGYKHHEHGGVTKSVSYVSASVNTRVLEVDLPDFKMQAGIPRDLSTLLSSMVEGKLRRPAPADRHLPEYEVRNVRSTTFAVYHGGGWLPAQPKLSTKVFTPYALTKNKWVIRPLDPSELLQVYDVPESQLGRLAPMVREADFPCLVPGKSLLAGASAGFAALRAAYNEGGASSPVSISSGRTFQALKPPKQLKEEGFLLVHQRERERPATWEAVGGATKKTKYEERPKRSTSDTGVESARGPEKERAQTDPLKSLKEEQANKRMLLGSFDASFDLPRRLDKGVVFAGTNPKDGSTKVPEEALDDMSRTKRERKATKSDDADVPIGLWTEHYVEGSTLDWEGTRAEQVARVEHALEVLRHKFAIRVWKRFLLKSFREWFESDKATLSSTKPKAQPPEVICNRDKRGKSSYSWSASGKLKYLSWYQARKFRRRDDWEACTDAMTRAANASWWEWQDGSRPFHWRWPEWYRKTIRDGLEVHISSKSRPKYTSPQRREADATLREQIKEKLNKVRARRYIASGFVSSLTSFFAVPKGESDIRMVYDGTKSGLNDAMWVPRFALPTIDTHLRSIEEGTFLADVDVGDCFLNFPLHQSLRALAGVDLSAYFPNTDGTRLWECWHRALMGVKSSPYQAVQGMAVTEEVIRGRPEAKDNVFRWNAVRMNCPGDPDYDPSKPWISKVLRTVAADGTYIDAIAADLVGYVDDLRPSGPSRATAWTAARRTASTMNYLGIQDAARKRRDSSQTPGAWAGAVVLTRDDGVYVMVDAEKWNKAKSMLLEVSEMLTSTPKAMNRKRLEQVRGFLNYVVRTYPPLKPYMTGFHLTIDGWRIDRDEEGWRNQNKKSKDKKATTNEETREWHYDSSKLPYSVDPKAPTYVEAKTRLHDDIAALLVLMQADLPRPRRVRSANKRQVIYCFGDASGAGFGFTMELNGILHYRYGQWSEIADGQSSNWRETRNLLEGLKAAAAKHSLNGVEVFIFTDNTTAEAAFWKGTSKSRALSEIILEMRLLEMTTDIVLHVIHVSGTRMIQQGTDGLSRADHSSGVMQGESMTRHIPLNEDAFVRSPKLEAKFRTLARELSDDGLNLKFLKPHQWFDEHHAYGNYVWIPPPAVTDAAVDLLNKARHKRPESLHLVLVPRLMTGRWRRALTRSADTYFKIDWEDCWPLSECHEPLLCFVFLPLSVASPQLSRRSNLVARMERSLSKGQLLQSSIPQKWNILRKFLLEARALCSLPRSVL